eukprot:CAMPEP_0197306010 /NCGR_PEP_ID=MMETSP0891-20130614/2463_1 /TAXON_ID=44058 ORGANISM="Aureoumbra lagunensis, Strain CCMP1510" /NCGR_SAMPLE_ID=MMETSP0891 /ASSEMBLY_ACC=CAM_ASM_000534 /LENGTH=306 /DNA_ID=CAMNT_0042787705 /DNA_START=99 /DNA_END=1019 /DNA_ORIENTATION=-
MTALQFPPQSQRKKAVKTTQRREVYAAVKAITGEQSVLKLHRKTVESQRKAAEEERLREMSHAELIRDAAQFSGNMSEEESYRLLERNARGEPMRFIQVPKNSKLRPALFHYRCLFPHPLTTTTGVDVLANNKTMRKIQHLEADQRCWHAVIANKPWCVEELYLQGFPLDSPDSSGMTPLHLASHFGYFECVLILLNSKSVDVNAQTICGVTALECSVATGHIEIEKILKEHGAQFATHRKSHSGYRSIIDIASDHCSPPNSQLSLGSMDAEKIKNSCIASSAHFPNTISHDLSRNLSRPPYLLQF